MTMVTDSDVSSRLQSFPELRYAHLKKGKVFNSLTEHKYKNCCFFLLKKKGVPALP